MKTKMFLGTLAIAVLMGGLAWAISGNISSLGLAQTVPDATVESNTLNPDALDEATLQAVIMASGQYAIKSAIGKVAPAVVQIDVTRNLSGRDRLGNDRIFEFFFNDPNSPFFNSPNPSNPQQRISQSLGSGVFIELDGQIYLLSNNHVVQGAKSIRVTTQEGKQFSAEIIGADASIDVAVLEVNLNGEPVPTATLGDSDRLEIGDWVVAIGNPLGLSHTVTAGIVSALSRDVANPQGNGRFRALVQTDAAINPGNSGGPLVNARGEVVGINTLIANDAEGLNFAININEVKRALPQLIQDGKLTRAWLGVFIQDLNGPLADQFGVTADGGVLVSDVIEGSPSVGVLQSGDVITHVNDEAVGNVSELQEAIMFKPVDDVVNLNIIRDQQPLTVQVTLGQRPEADEVAPAQSQSQQVEPLEQFGLRVQSITPELTEQLGLDTDQGVVIAAVAANSRAFWANPQPRQGDVIVEVNRQQITSLNDWNELVQAIDEDVQVVLTLMRGGRTFFVALP